MIKRGSHRRGFAWGAVWLSCCAALGCGGKAHEQGTAGTGGTNNTAERKCQGTLEVLDKKTVEMDCETGVVALGGGIFRLMLESEDGDSLMLIMPSLETGSYSSGDCATASLNLASENGNYLADELAFEGTSMALDLERSGDLLSVALSGVLCDYVADNGSGMPGPLCVEATLPNLRAPIHLEQLACECPARSPMPDFCEPQACDIGRCYSFQCPLSAALCTEP